MDWASNEVIEVLRYLIPGLIVSWVFHGLTFHAKPSPFERVVQALIFTFLIQAIMVPWKSLLFFLGEKFCTVGYWSDEVALVHSALWALAVGLLVSYLTNNDKLHALLRYFRITQRTSYPSEWFSAFCESNNYVVLHLSGERRLYGWPAEWPNSPKGGHFVVSHAEWLNNGTRLDEAERLIVPAAEVEMVELVPWVFEPNTEPENP